MPSNWSRHKQTKWHFSKTPFAYIENDDLEDPLLFSVNQAHNKAADVAELRPLQIIGVQERHVLYDDDNNPVEETWIGLKAKHAPNGSASTLVVDSDGCFGARDTSENIFVPGQIHFVESLDRLRVNVKRSGCATRIQWLK